MTKLPLILFHFCDINKSLSKFVVTQNLKPIKNNFFYLHMDYQASKQAQKDLEQTPQEISIELGSKRMVSYKKAYA